MLIDNLVTHFEGVKMRGRNGFTARCPAHHDRHASLSVRKGETSWLVTCWAGCKFVDIARGAGLSPLAFKFGGTSSKHSIVQSADGRRRLAEMMMTKRKIPFTFAEIADVALSLTEQQKTDMATWYPTWSVKPLHEVMKMRHVVFDTVIWDVLGKAHRRDWGNDWYEAKDNIEEALWETYRTNGSALVAEFGPA